MHVRYASSLIRPEADRAFARKPGEIAIARAPNELGRETNSSTQAAVIPVYTGFAETLTQLDSQLKHLQLGATKPIDLQLCGIIGGAVDFAMLFKEARVDVVEGA